MAFKKDKTPLYLLIHSGKISAGYDRCGRPCGLAEWLFLDSHRLPRSHFFASEGLSQRMQDLLVVLIFLETHLRALGQPFFLTQFIGYTIDGMCYGLYHPSSDGGWASYQLNCADRDSSHEFMEVVWLPFHYCALFLCGTLLKMISPPCRLFQGPFDSKFPYYITVSTVEMFILP